MESFTDTVGLLMAFAVFLFIAAAFGWFWLLCILEEDSKRALWQQEQLRHPFIYADSDVRQPTIDPLSDAAVNGKGR